MLTSSCAFGSKQDSWYVRTMSISLQSPNSMSGCVPHKGQTSQGGPSELLSGGGGGGGGGGEELALTESTFESPTQGDF
jgi:hypothetical protein